MRIGLTAYDIAAPEFNQLAVAADTAGFASLWLGEHVVLPVGYATEHPTTELADAKHIAGPVVSADTELVDPLVQLGAAAALTSRIELATGIFVVPLRHPLAVARSTCTVQELAGGRFVLGVGFGWLREEFDALDVPFGQRVGRFEESLEVLRIAWSGGVVEYSGRHFEIAGVQVTARPTHVPLILGGNSDNALDRAVRLGDGWFASGTPTFEAAQHLKDEIERRHRASARRDDPFRVIFRVPDATPATIEQYADAGFDEVLVWADQLWDPEVPADERPERLVRGSSIARLRGDPVSTHSMNRQMVLRERPTGDITDDCFELIERPVEAVQPGQVLVRTLWLSFDPAQRGWLNDVASYAAPVELGAPMRAWGVGQVIESDASDYEPGQLVYGTLNWQEFARIDVGDSDLEVIPPEISDPRLMLSLLGTTGLTAYFGMVQVANVGAGDSVLVTAAAGATGSVAGQIARARGATRIVGTAGSADKRDWVTNVAGFDECLDHYDPKIRRAIRDAAGDGFDVVYDNVGGSLLDAAIMGIAVHGRIALCGAISTGYRPERPAEGLFAYQLLTTRRVRMEGFLLNDFEADFAAARAELSAWHEAGAIVVEHDTLVGLERAPEGLQRLFSGGNLGKQILQLAEPD